MLLIHACSSCGTEFGHTFCSEPPAPEPLAEDTIQAGCFSWMSSAGGIVAVKIWSSSGLLSRCLLHTRRLQQLVWNSNPCYCHTFWVGRGKQSVHLIWVLFKKSTVYTLTHQAASVSTASLAAHFPHMFRMRSNWESSFVREAKLGEVGGSPRCMKWTLGFSLLRLAVLWLPWLPSTSSTLILIHSRSVRFVLQCSICSKTVLSFASPSRQCPMKKDWH